MNRNSQKTREKILKTATKLFLQKGVDQVGVREIAAKAGINLSLMNYYFQTKENLFETIFDSLVMDKAIKLRSILESDLPIEKKIRDYTNTYIDMLIGNPLLVSFVVSSLHRSPEQLKSMNAVVALYNSEVFCKHLISEAEAGRIRRVDPEQLYISMLPTSLRKKDSDMKIDKTTYEYRKERPIGMTADHTSRPDKVLFFADLHFLFLETTTKMAHYLLPNTQVNASQKSKSHFSLRTKRVNL
ncbi:MAG TPA: TetR/AcrR family transcriptional regulator [Tenuifilaceae bacterium]|nr:TetR/AcrR family transcriptional regulator [Tenuifilaceae bacterium]HQI58139.1 TetR/AcrR family transcriptional regulator [Tenuifilaceae bacterium]